MVDALNNKLYEKDTFIEVIKESHQCTKNHLNIISESGQNDLVLKLQDEITDLKCS